MEYLYSRLNNNHQRKFGVKLQQWPRIQLVLKQYETGYKRKTAHIFTKDQILRGLQVDNATPEWILRKCAISLAFCGGLRCAELKSIKVGDLTQDDEGMWVHYFHAKQKGEEKKNRFLVPFDRNNPHMCFASRVLSYSNSKPQIQPDEDLFHKSLKEGYGKAVMGVNYLAKTGRMLAAELGLEDPDAYTGHCFRRTAATEAANAGANTLQMKRHFGWKQESTALKYTEETKERARKMARFLTGNEQNDVEVPTLAMPAQSTSGEAVGTANINAPATITCSQTETGGQTISSVKVGQEDEKKIFNFYFQGSSGINLNFQ